MITLGLSICKRSEYDGVLIIPNEDRFVFHIGDRLLYKCSTGLTEQVQVYNVTLKTEVEQRPNIWGKVRTYAIDYQDIGLIPIEDTWTQYFKDYFISEVIQTNYFQISSVSYCQKPGDFFIDYPSEYPGARIMIKGDSGRIVALTDDRWGWINCVDYDEIVINKRNYRNVYFFKDSAEGGYSLYWSLSYGIIRFVIYTPSDSIYWDLESER